MSEQWIRYRELGIINTNEELCVMMQDVLEAIDSLCIINPEYYKMVVDRLVLEYQGLESIARSRRIEQYPKLDK